VNVEYQVSPTAREAGSRESLIEFESGKAYNADRRK
jgi:hypothetical protein